MFLTVICKLPVACKAYRKLKGIYVATLRCASNEVRDVSSNKTWKRQ